ncbi:hypothetical protein NESM_000910700 [Novymonas esmeraldas]|uniref:RNase H type-1 domain-containing protein n=1 Tax=Novymonas esmeraldas TaxID=1808958 RepID=A0AAW0EZ20_9TRYP
MKAARRLMARLNRNLIRPQDAARLPPSARRQPQAWWRAAAANEPRHIHKSHPQAACFDVYSDATPDGWGAVCIERESKATVILGARWPRRADNINAAETRAITMALSELRPRFPPGCNIHLHVDNTSALASVERRRARSYAVNEELHRLLPYLDEYQVTASYIASAANPADAPSRANQRHRHSTLRHGSGGAPGQELLKERGWEPSTLVETNNETQNLLPRPSTRNSGNVATVGRC